ncbi:tyrosine-type recombinase/integrase [Priestia megaterium]|uniref:tyrosine-type recombinase/integrase n=1 Tax=Priestia megaterium TaxID=1404 RepID=UPI001865F6A8|nr:tyrosine-type recombinase/integrase [Priestia megaterium]MBE2975806.1 site-specific integrase [Priestia megaterium]
MKEHELSNQEVLKNNIKWHVDSVSKVLYPLENETSISSSEWNYPEPSVQLTEKVNAADQYWDFSESDRFYKSPCLYKYDFQDIVSSTYRIVLKKMVLRELHDRENRFSTTNTYFNIVKAFIHFIEAKFIYNPLLIYPNLINEFLLKEKSSITEASKRQILSAIGKFFQGIEYSNVGFRLSEFEEMLSNYNRKRINAQSNSGKTPNIPRFLLNQIIQLALNDIEDQELSITYRMTACMIVILSQTGMRRGEFLLLETGRLKEILIKKGEKKAYYLEFITYKTTMARDGRWTETNMNELAVKAYETLVDLTTDRRKQQTGSNVLYCTKKGMSYNRSIIQKHIYGFFSRHQKVLDFSSLSNENLQNLSKWVITENDVSDYRYITQEDVGKTFYHVRPHQFRVVVANELRDKGLTLQWIKRHMNHLEEEMTKHYFRDDKIITDAFKNRASQDGSQLETNIFNIEDEKIKKELEEPELKLAYEAINKFLKKKKLNIFKDLDEILSLLKKTPVRESEMGFCTNTIKLCERQERLAMFEKWYYVRPQIVDITNIKFTLERFENKLRLVAHNEKAASQNKKFQRQFELESKSLQQFYRNKLLPELTLLKKNVYQFGKEELIIRYPKLKKIIENINNIEEEIPPWVVEMS